VRHNAEIIVHVWPTAYANMNSSISKDADPSRCPVWIGDQQLIDTHVIGTISYSTAGADSQDSPS